MKRTIPETLELLRKVDEHDRWVNARYRDDDAWQRLARAWYRRRTVVYRALADHLLALGFTPQILEDMRDEGSWWPT